MGIREGYPRIPVDRKVKAYVQLSRPFTMVPPILGGLCGGLMGYFSVFGGLSMSAEAFYRLVYAIVTLIFLQFGSNVLNQAMEVDLDRVNKPYRPIPSGLVSREEGMWLAMMFFVFSLARAYVVNEVFATVVASIVVLTLFYSCPPLYLKKRLWLGYLDLGLTRGFLGFLSTWVIFGPVNTVSLSLSLVMGVYVFGANVTKDFSDVEGDRMFGVRTAPVAYGVKRACYIAAPFFVAPFALIPLLVSFNLIPSCFNFVNLLSPLGVYSAYVMVRNPYKVTLTENTLAWTLFYVQFALLFVFFFLSYVLL